MAVFDDPRKELRRLQEQLLAEEEDEQDEYGETCDEEVQQEPFYRNYSNGYGSDIRNFANGYRGEALRDEEDEEYLEDWDTDNAEPHAVYYETRRQRRKRIRREKAEKKQRRKKNATARLKFLLVVETLILLAILIWLVMNR